MVLFHQTSTSQQLQQQELIGQYSRSVGARPENKKKNRYKSFLPCELFVLILKFKLSVSHQRNRFFMLIAEN